MMLDKVTRKIFRILLIISLSASAAFAQMLILSPAENSVTNLHHIAVSVMGKPSAEASLYINDELVSTGEIRVDGIFDFLNISVPDGPVSLRVEAMGALNRLYSAERKIHILGPPKQVLPYEDNIEIPAGEKINKVVSFEIHDEWGYRLDHLKVATIYLEKGAIINEDIDTMSAGIQIPVTEGVIDIEIQSPARPGRSILRVEISGASFDQSIQYTTAQLPFILVGSLSGAASNYQDFGDNSNAPDVEEWRQDSTSIFGLPVMGGGRAALYAKGTIFNKFGLTVSYDSKRNYTDEFYRDIDPNDQYAVYGDASILSYDAQSQSPLFVKLEHNESSLIYGDFNTSITKSEFTAYNRTFNGFVTNIKEKDHAVRGFATLTDREMKLDEIRGEGISGYYYLSENNVTEHSDKVVIITRDRYHTEEIIKYQEMIRFQDYSINYEDGSIMFKQPVASVDENGNPVTINIAYEHQTGKRNTFIGGLRYDGTFFNKLKVGALAVMEEQDSANYFLYGVNASLPINKWVAMKGEFAGSSTPQISGNSLNGQAYKVEMQVKASDFFNANAYFRSVDSSFVNNSQSGANNETGSTKYGVKGVLGNKITGQLSSEYYMQRNKMGTVNENTAEVFNATYKRDVTEKANFMLAYENAKRNDDAAEDSVYSRKSSILRAKFNYQILKKLNGFVERDQNLASGDQSKPTYTGVGLKYSITEKIGVMVKYKRIEGDTPGNQFVFGLDTKIGDNTDISGKYEIGGATDNDRNRATIGLKNKWAVTDELTLNFAYENVSTSDRFETPTTEHQALSVAYEYLPEIPFKTSGKYEFNIKKETIQNNALFNVDLKVLNGLAIIAKTVYSRVDYRANNDDYYIKSNNQIGLAYRPERSDQYNALLKAAYVVNKNTHVQNKINDQRFILSTHHYWQPTEKLEIGFRYAHRLVIDEEIGLFKDKVSTNFLAIRLEYDLDLKWYAASDLRFIHMMPTNELKTSSSIEVGYLLTNNLQLGVGYAFNTFEDSDFSSQNYTLKNFFLTLHMKFSEDLFNWR
jgi:hypothetical protein